MYHVLHICLPKDGARPFLPCPDLFLELGRQMVDTRASAESTEVRPEWTWHYGVLLPLPSFWDQS
jgi:hypothetical protein